MKNCQIVIFNNINKVKIVKRDNMKKIIINLMLLFILIMAQSTIAVHAQSHHHFINIKTLDYHNATKSYKCRQNIFKLDEKEINITQYTFKCCLNGIIFKSEIIEQQKELNVDIEFLDTTILGRYGIRIVLENKGDETVYDIDWKISVTGGLLDLIKKDFSNRILILEPGNQIKLHTPRFFGIGIILIQVKLYVEEVGEIAEEICGRQKCFRTVI
jgi:hypothetical protein